MKNNYKLLLNSIFILSILKITFCYSNDTEMKSEVLIDAPKTTIVSTKLSSEAIIAAKQLEASNKDNFGTKMIEASRKFGLDGVKELADSGKNIIISTVLLVIFYLLTPTKNTVTLDYRSH